MLRPWFYNGNERMKLNIVNRGDKTALDMPVLITNIWCYVSTFSVETASTLIRFQFHNHA